jgi:hypothetical protein
VIGTTGGEILRRASPAAGWLMVRFTTAWSAAICIDSDALKAKHHSMITKNLGMLLLAIYLILVGITSFTAIIPAIVLGVLALIAGILILLGK